MPSQVAFFVRHFGERGTEVAVYDYADCNETILGNKSIIIHFPKQKYLGYGYPYIDCVFEKFKKRFRTIEVQEFSDINSVLLRENIPFFYMQTAGCAEPPHFAPIINTAKYIIHCVFFTNYRFGDVYTPISDSLNTKFNTNYPVIPYMVRVADTNDNLRDELEIPADAKVFGRYGGLYEFGIPYAQEAVIETAKHNPNMYFVFMNTAQFGPPLENIKFLPRSIDMIRKRKFINTCDAYLHARGSGETFGLAVGEFAVCGKPIITCRSIDGDNAHLDILGSDAIIYSDKESLRSILLNFDKTKHDMSNNGYLKYTPEVVMKQFANVAGIN